MVDVNRNNNNDTVVAARIIQISKAVLAVGSATLLAKFLLTAFAINGVLSALASVPALLFHGGVSGGCALILKKLHEETDQAIQKLVIYINNIRAFMSSPISIAASAIAMSAMPIVLIRAVSAIPGIITAGFNAVFGAANSAAEGSQAVALVEQSIGNSPLHHFLNSAEAKARAEAIQARETMQEIAAIRRELNPWVIPPEVSVMFGGTAIRYLTLRGTPREETPRLAIVNQAAVTTAVVAGRLVEHYGYGDRRIGVFNVGATAITAMVIKICREPELRNQPASVIAKKMLPSVVNPVATLVSLSALSKLIGNVFQPNVASILIGVTSAGIGIFCEFKTIELLDAREGADRAIEDSHSTAERRVANADAFSDDDEGELIEGLEENRPARRNKTSVGITIRNAVLVSGASAATSYFVGKVISDKQPTWASAAPVVAPVITACIFHFGPKAFNVVRDLVDAFVSDIGAWDNNDFGVGQDFDGDRVELDSEIDSLDLDDRNPLGGTPSFGVGDSFSMTVVFIHNMHRENRDIPQMPFSSSFMKPSRAFTPGFNDRHIRPSFMQAPVLTPGFNNYRHKPLYALSPISSVIPCHSKVRQIFSAVESGSRGFFNNR